MFVFTSTLRRATLVILMARRPKFKLHFVSFTSPREGAMQICKTKFYIGHFRVLLCLCFKTTVSAKPFTWKWVLHAGSFPSKSKLIDKNGFALRLVQKQRYLVILTSEYYSVFGKLHFLDTKTEGDRSKQRIRRNRMKTKKKCLRWSLFSHCLRGSLVGVWWE